MTLALIFGGWFLALVGIGIFLSGARRVSAARNAAAQQHWNTEGRVLAEANMIIKDATRDLEAER